MAKKLAKSANPAYISPTDNLMTPVTAKLSLVKKKHFIKGKPITSPFAPVSAKDTTSPHFTLDENEKPSEKSPLDNADIHVDAESEEMAL